MSSARDLWPSRDGASMAFSVSQQQSSSLDIDNVFEEGSNNDENDDELDAKKDTQSLDESADEEAPLS
jgi:hypothetical protein